MVTSFVATAIERSILRKWSCSSGKRPSSCRGEPILKDQRDRVRWRMYARWARPSSYGRSGAREAGGVAASAHPGSPCTSPPQRRIRSSAAEWTPGSGSSRNMLAGGLEHLVLNRRRDVAGRGLGPDQEQCLALAHVDRPVRSAEPAAVAGSGSGRHAGRSAALGHEDRGCAASRVQRTSGSARALEGDRRPGPAGPPARFFSDSSHGSWMRLIEHCPRETRRPAWVVPAWPARGAGSGRTQGRESTSFAASVPVSPRRLRISASASAAVMPSPS